MTKYILKRLVHGLVSIVIVIGIVMFLIYSVMNRDLIFAKDSSYSHMNNNQRTTYKYSMWEQYGYLDYVPYSEWLQELADSGEIDEETRSAAVAFGRTSAQDSDIVTEYIKKFVEEYQSKGYKIKRMDAVMLSAKKVADGGQQQLFAYKDISLFSRLGSYLKSLITIDDLDNVPDDQLVGERGLTFTWFDPVYGGEKFSPALIGNGTTNKYLIYCDSKFPYIHQNIFKIKLGTSYTVNTGVDVYDTMSQNQGTIVKSEVIYPTGYTEKSADNLHSATFVANSQSASTINEERYTDNYTNVVTVKNGHSKVAYSFMIGLVAIFLEYLIGLPIGIAMARKKEGFVDKLGTVYIVFIMSVPSLAYILLFKSIGSLLKLPISFNVDEPNIAMYVLPIVSLSLPMVGSLMRWLRRYMIDQMNSDYVKFARSGGLTENEIFTKHIFKNAMIPIVHGIPGEILACLVGAIITESVYVVPGAGNLLTQAISKYDNGVIVGVTLFYASLTVISLILGDILMSMVDPRISFSEKDR